MFTKQKVLAAVGRNVHLLNIADYHLKHSRFLIKTFTCRLSPLENFRAQYYTILFDPLDMIARLGLLNIANPSYMSSLSTDLHI